MQVVDVDLGSGVPHIRNLQALASPTATIWPQALFDLEFTGPSHCLCWKMWHAWLPCLHHASVHIWPVKLCQQLGIICASS